MRGAMSQVTKTVADKILKELGEKKEIGMNSTKKEEKGSQFVFWALQVRNFSSITPPPFRYSLALHLFPNLLTSHSTTRH